ncbi:MAG TPA: hypothetical protein VL147_12395, partial [Devosia sp.]|nr:hypothetical protein [Devosia sp.]
MQVYLRRRQGVSAGAFRKFVNDKFAPALAGVAPLTELRTQTFLPWVKALWNTPNVAHDNPADQRFHAAVVLGFADSAAQEAFFVALRGTIASVSFTEVTRAPRRSP